MLADFEIRKAVEEGYLAITPFDDTQLQPVSYDLTLGPDYRRFRSDVQTIETKDDGRFRDDVHQYGLVPSWKDHTTGHLIPPQGLRLRPGDFILACTLEHIALCPTLVGIVEGKSSIGRLGVSIHATAGFIDPGFNGQITLEIKNDGPVAVMLHTGMPICQITFDPVSLPEKDYSVTGHYQGQVGPTPSRYRWIKH